MSANVIHESYVRRAGEFLAERRIPEGLPAAQTITEWQAYRAGAGEVIIEQLLEVIEGLAGGSDGN